MKNIAYKCAWLAVGFAAILALVVAWVAIISMDRVMW